MPYAICIAMQGREDFGAVDEEHQRCFLLIAAVALCGPLYYAQLLAEAMEANDPL